MRRATLALTFAAVVAMIGCHRASLSHRTFATPEDAVRALIDAAKAGKMDDLRAIFGPDAGDLIASSDPATARQNREIFAAAAAERWQVVDEGTTSKVLVVGNERWPFPVPLAKVADGWQFDTAAGKEEILDRRIGRNELAAIRLCHTYVSAQRLYASRGHDGRPAGVYAATFRSTPGKEDGLFWPAAHGQKRSPLGDLVAQAAMEGTPLGTTGQPAPFHGYYFRILTAQGPDAPGGSKSYVANGHLSAGFALVAWPAQYDVTGITTFVVNQDGVVREKDLGPQTDATAKSMPHYNPDSSWPTVQ
ncbi:MAG TPA: DUF2950 domain-containing protein [Vicinamibacterales bacterium]|jgi:hypothetical protein